MPQHQQTEAAAELPSAALLSNGRYSLVIQSDGGGHSAYGGRLLSPRLGYGISLYVQDAENAATLSAGSKAVGADDAYAAGIGPGSYRIRRKEDGIGIASDICVVPNRDAELRRFTLSNTSDQKRRLLLTIVTEIAASTPALVAIEPIEHVSGIMARRAEPDGDETYWLHTIVEPEVVDVEPFESGRDTFFRDSRARPPGLDNGRETDGEPPLIGLRVSVELDPNEQRSLTLACCAAGSRDDAVATAEALQDEQALADAFLEAALYEQRTRDDLKIGPRNADRYHRIGAAILRGDAFLRAAAPSPTDSEASRKTLPLGETGGEQDPIRRLGLDPDKPLAVCRVSDESEMHVVRLMLKARTFWESLGLDVQVLFLNDKSGAGADALQRTVHEAIELDGSAADGVILRHADVVTPEDQRAVQEAARLVLTSDRMSLLRVAPK